ncbi:hypothetical protein [Parendozoicomonas haliclonae]|uniref:Uncharacterized protein n=1 Tax=Parendozoicomonas haliclonae TaxID=1960125 RepID=A0A1X7AHN0_9GAMM|nr:hypothetical protein [Parendozoicomonas haliclonae]SMA41817.1 hypothetical protein EHSB41UT_01335 [Parendozoicomonas haliclonae]
MTNDTELKWELSHIANRRKAYDYMRSMKNIFCVYSASVCKLYSNYQLHYTGEEGAELIEVMPDQNAWHDTFSFVSPQAVRPSGIFMFPGELFGKTGFYVRLPLKGGKGKTMPLSEAFDQVLGKRDNFLPLIKKGDLREFKAKSPYVHLHWLDIDKLEELSTFQRLDIASTITTRFHDMVKTAAAEEAIS